MNNKIDYKALTDEDLVEAIKKSQDTLLFEVLYDRFVHLVYNKCFNFTRIEDEAEDLTQDIFLKLFIKLPTFEGKSKFSTWLYAFTYNHCVNFVKRDKGHLIQNKSIPVEEYDHLLIETSDHSLFQIQESKLRDALNLINPYDKMLLLLKYQDDLSIKDISKAFEIGESAVKMRLKRAKARVVELCNEKV